MGKNTQADQVISYVYIHVPFCLKKCNYCSFFSIEFSKDVSKRFVTYLIKEINLFKQKSNINPKTIYFGGGTPSLLTAAQINLIISQFDITRIEEITIECNPVNINVEFINELKTTEVNRISLGAQSFIDKELMTLGRLHKADEIRNAFKILRSNKYNNVSLDLIYGLPSQTKEDVEFSLDEIIQLNPEHISTYCLSLENDVPLFSKINKIPADDKVAEFYYLTRKKLISAGYDHYEISNFARSCFESKHNLCYWNDEHYLGLGPSAAGYIENIRYCNSTNFEEYYKMQDNDEIMMDKAIVSDDDHEKEYIFLGLRKANGIDLVEFEKKFETNFTRKYGHIIHKFQNLLEVNNETIKLKPEAYFISNEIFVEFM